MAEATTRDELKEKFTPDPELSLRSRAMLRRLHASLGEAFCIRFINSDYGRNLDRGFLALIEVVPNGLISCRWAFGGDVTKLTTHVDNILCIEVVISTAPND